ncbi:MAG TPA: SHOCT domain-containing protein [Candidatus Limnocylindria bacterium]|nr:SHOCT domain-containing protein [Candidatus Limnocylindria bacterium]
MMWGWGVGGDWLAMGLGMLLWVALIGVAVWLVVRALGQRPGASGTESAEELLRRRFASGEIDAEEYERRLEILRRR